MSVLVLPGIVVLANSLYESHFGPPGHGGKSVLFNSVFGVTWLLIMGHLWVMMGRRKTVHHYSIHHWLGLDIEARSEISLPWSSYQRVLIDRPNNRVVACQADRNDRFDVHLPEHLLDRFLSILGSLLPDTALFIQNR